MIPPPSREHSYVLLRRSTAYLCPPPSPFRFLSPENAHFLFDPASNAIRRTACIKNPSCVRPTKVHEACIHIEKRGKRVTWLPLLPDDPMQLLSRRGRPPSAAEAVLLFN